MFTLPQILSLPALSGLDAGTLQWPAIGLVLAWFVIAAFVGISLGFLRECASGPAKRTASDEHPSVRLVPPAHREPAHCEAA